MSLPDNLQQDAFALDGKALLILYKLQLYDGTIFLMSPRGEFIWNGMVFDEHPCHMTGFEKNADGSLSRPKFSFANPAGMFTAAIHTRLLENGTVTRYRLLKEDLNQGEDAALSESARITRVVDVNEQSVSVECRGALDGANYKIPARRFSPPEFPYVTLR